MRRVGESEFVTLDGVMERSGAMSDPVLDRRGWDYMLVVTVASTPWA